MENSTVLLAIAGAVPLVLGGLMLAFPLIGTAVAGLALVYLGAAVFLGTVTVLDQATAAMFVVGGLVLFGIAGSVRAIKVAARSRPPSAGRTTEDPDWYHAVEEGKPYRRDRGAEQHKRP